MKHDTKYKFLLEHIFSNNLPATNGGHTFSRVCNLFTPLDFEVVSKDYNSVKLKVSSPKKLINNFVESLTTPPGANVLCSISVLGNQILAHLEV